MDAFTKGASYFRQTVGAEDKQGDNKNYNPLPTLHTEHFPPPIMRFIQTQLAIRELLLTSAEGGQACHPPQGGY